MREKYNDVALHFDKSDIPQILKDHLQTGPISLADFGCGDGPWFNIFQREGFISADQPVFAIDLEPERLARVQERFPWISIIVAPADSVPKIETGCLDWVISTMVMEHVPDESRYLREVYRVLKPGGKAYITTVYKRKWAWYFRKRNGESVLDTSHLREYTDLDSFQNLILKSGRLEITSLEIKPLWFPLLDPVLFRIGKYLRPTYKILKLIRSIKVPIIGYYELHLLITKSNQGNQKSL
jgi:ubiquinone/menaquinone biosynthesis C-methylase UbiE